MHLVNKNSGEKIMCLSMNKAVSKEIGNKSLKSWSEENRKIHAKQRNCCVSLPWNVKREYYSNLNVKNISDNVTFWKTDKPF